MEPPYFSATGRFQRVGTSGAIPEISQPCTFSAHGAPGFTHSESCLFNEISYQNPIEKILFINRCKPRFMFRKDVFRVLGPPSGGLSHGRLASFGENNFSLFIERGRDRISSEVYLLFVKKKLIHSFHSCSHSTISMSTTTTFLLWTICN